MENIWNFSFKFNPLEILSKKVYIIHPSFIKDVFAHTSAMYVGIEWFRITCL